MKEIKSEIKDLTNIKIDLILNKYIEKLNLDNSEGGDVECEPK